MNLVENANAKLLHQFEDSPKLKGLIKSLVLPFQEVLDHIESLHNGRYIDQACGPTLDVIGELVRQPRDGMTDEEFRPWIKVRIHLNNGSGTPENVFAILIILFGSKAHIKMEEYPPNDVIFSFFKFPKCPLDTLFRIIRSAAPVTVECQFLNLSTPNSDIKPTHLGVVRSTQDYQHFRFDFTAFSASHFADFFEEDMNARK